MTTTNTLRIRDLLRLDRAVRAAWEPCTAPGHEGRGCQAGWLEAECGCSYTFHTLSGLSAPNACDTCRGLPAPAVGDPCECGHADHDSVTEGFSPAPGRCPGRLGATDIYHCVCRACLDHDWDAHWRTRGRPDLAERT